MKKWYGPTSGLSREIQDYLNRLNPEKHPIVTDNSSMCLIRSAAGSGKTTALIAKYLYLTRVKGYDYRKVHYLSYNNENVQGVKDALKRLIPEDEINEIATTFHSLALKIIDANYHIWPEMIESVKTGFVKKRAVKNGGHDEDTDHSRAAVFLNKLGPKINDLLSKNRKLKEDVIKTSIRKKGYGPHKYVCYKEDRNHIPGSCRSIVEKEVFEYLASNGVDFAYEEPNCDIRFRPDFTIYLPNDEKLYYEHYAKLDDDNPTPEEVHYHRSEKYKKKRLENHYKSSFFYTKGADKNGVIETVRQELSRRGIETSDVSSKGDISIDKVMEDVVSLYCNARQTILESGMDVKSVEKTLSKRKDQIGFFFRNVFSLLEELYNEYLSNPNVYTDFSDSLIKAIDICNGTHSKEVLDKFSYDVLLVDEYQDISQLRYKFLQALRHLNKKMKIVAVGDDWQSIYSFACGDISLFHNWEGTTKDMTQLFRFGNPLSSIAEKFVTANNSLTDHKIKPDKDVVTDIEFVDCPKKTQWNWIKKKVHSLPKSDKLCKVLVLSRFNEEADGCKNWIGNYVPKNVEIKYMAMHSAKGKEADYVFIQDCNIGVIPYVKSYSKMNMEDLILACIRDEDIEEKKLEERRLFYVALTRAKIKVFILYLRDKESPYVKEIKEIMRNNNLEPIITRL